MFLEFQFLKICFVEELGRDKWFRRRKRRNKWKSRREVWWNKVVIRIIVLKVGIIILLIVIIRIVRVIIRIITVVVVIITVVILKLVAVSIDIIRVNILILCKPIKISISSIPIRHSHTNLHSLTILIGDNFNLILLMICLWIHRNQRILLLIFNIVQNPWWLRFRFRFESFIWILKFMYLII